ncbi:hypothetical protein ANCCEY_07123 [Ancylostoma ceylanicum]|uniref:Uncharacterized protein n=1 Tax=Ancylostoma ceylanicum TaxID=53326 RepID=A0A0D6LUQ0_9BILA|nr:hypothetical protein ANCCEY_07123 [Ancylostoma ceylanicum]
MQALPALALYQYMPERYDRTPFLAPSFADPESSLPATPRSGENGGQSSPRRPLYVDTQLANGVGEKRRSPVTSVVDFVRGRNRASSLSGPATPPSPPTTMSVSARASASTDGGVPTSSSVELPCLDFK